MAYDLQRDSRVPADLRNRQRELNNQYQNALRVGDLFRAYQLEQQLHANLNNINQYRKDN